MTQSSPPTNDISAQKDSLRLRYGASGDAKTTKGALPQGGKVAALIRACPAYRTASHILVPPSSFFYQVRLSALMDGKKLTIPSPGMQKGFHHFDPARLRPGERVPAAHLRAVGSRLTRDAYDMGLPCPVDLLIGEAICAGEDGSFVGEGKGHLDLLFAVLTALGWLHAQAQTLVVVTTPQILPTCPQEAHDVRAHWIVTAREAIRCHPEHFPEGRIVWEKLSKKQIRRNDPLFNLAAKLGRPLR